MKRFRGSVDKPGLWPRKGGRLSGRGACRFATQVEYIGQRRTRVEDARLVQGQGRYVSDVAWPGQLVMAVVRSTHAHARIRAIDGSEALRSRGVFGVYTARDLGGLNRPMPMGIVDTSFEPALQTPLAADKVRYVGEPVAVVLAEDRYLAEDAVEKVRVDYEPLEPVIDLDEAAADRVLIHEARGSNVLGGFEHTVGAGEAALATADLVVEEVLRIGRVSGQPMEPRGVVARYDAEQGVLEVYLGTQSAHGAKGHLVAMLGLPPEKVRVIAPDVGGGFGVKMGAYPEDILAAYLALTLGRPVKWAGDRMEEFLATNQEREALHRVKLGVQRDGRIVALVDRFLQDCGAYTPMGSLIAHTTAINLAGAYRVPNLYVSYQLVATNKVPVGPYRGAGRPQGHFVIERMLDRAADRLGLSRIEIRRRNLIPPEAMPYDTGLVLRTGDPIAYDTGNFPEGFESLVAALEPRLEERRRAAERQGRWVGLGVANYVEISAAGGFEGAIVEARPDGTFLVFTGAAAQGQGHRTTLAQVVADRLGVPFESVTVVEGDTALIARGVGTFSSRTMVMAGNAASQAATAMRQELLAAAAKELEVAVEDLEWEAGRIRVRGVPASALTLAEVVQRLLQSQERVRTEAYFSAKGATYGFGSHGVIVEVDPATGGVSLRDYVMVHDGGQVINPLLADGQIIGAAVQGIGTALYEEIRYDPQGQPLNTTYLDYLLPGSAEMPDFELIHQRYAATNNPEGFKGLGEAGIIPSMAVVLSAVEDALAAGGVPASFAATPVTPEAIFAAMNQGGVSHEAASV